MKKQDNSVRSLERIRELTDILNFNKSRNSLDESNKKLKKINMIIISLLKANY